ncbi:hypothetical protein N2152v2_004426 [Parachlorella kessleri]
MWRALVVALGLALAGACAAEEGHCYFAGPRVDCGYVGITQDVCEDKGCCWVPAEFKGAPSVDLPWCFHPNNAASEYRFTNIDVRAGDGGGLEGSLELTQSTQKELGPDIEMARVSLEQVSGSILRVKITDARQKRWEIPTWLFASEVLNGSAAAKSRSPAGRGSRLYDLSYTRDPFSFKVSRRGKGGRAVFDTTGTRLVFKDQYLELTSWVDGKATLFGAGERSSETLHLPRNGLPLTLWGHDLGPTFLLQNMYGAHPFVLAVEEDGSSWGALLFNSNGMDIVATEDRVSWRAIGGVFDLFIFMGPSPLDVMDHFTYVVGRPAMIPYWTLGFHQCKRQLQTGALSDGYKTVWEVEEVVANYSAAQIPLETIWTDIDHMDGWRDFTFHPKNFPLPEMQRFVAKLHDQGQKWVPIVDPGIKVDKGYVPYDRGLEQDVFMRGVNGEPYLGWVWPGACHFPDFFDPKAQDFFSQLLKEHHGLVPWDGIWIDMDEGTFAISGIQASVAAAGLCQVGAAPDRPISRAELRDDPPWVCQLDCPPVEGLNATQKRLLDPPYQIANYLQRLPLGTKSMSVLAYHHNGDLQYNTHNLYGLSEIKTTAEAVQAIRGKRPFILSRASFTGLGAYGAHWTGDNAATWHDLVWSLPGVMNIGLFGIPMGGNDLCGFQGDTNEELCSRWIAAGAFMPLARDHSDLHSGYQELYRWPKVAETARRVLGLRYRLLPFLYTQFRTARETGAPVMRPLFMNFPKDPDTHKISRQFMVGKSLLVTPVLEEGANAVEGYFPAGRWYSLWDKQDVVDAREGGRTVKLDAPLGTIPVHMLGGTALAMQQGGMTTTQVKRSPLTVVVALPEAVTGGEPRKHSLQHLAVGVAGHVYNDDGESIEVGNSPCNFLTFNTSIGYNPVGNRYQAQVDLHFGRPDQARDRVLTSHEAACDSDSAFGGWEWPLLDGVEVWGWQAGAENALVEVLVHDKSCSSYQVVQRSKLNMAEVSSDGHGIKLDLKALHLQLECPYALRESSLLTSALTLIEERDIHPVGAGKYQCTEYTLAGMYGLAKRAQLTHEELDEEILLTLLWILEAWSSQYRGFLDDVLEDYLAKDPWLCSSTKEEKLALQRRMARIQLHVLKRCDWRMGLDDARDLRPALAVLTSHPDFSSYCLLIECEASRLHGPPSSSLQSMELDSVAEGSGSMGTVAAASHATHGTGRKRQREDSSVFVQPAEP